MKVAIFLAPANVLAGRLQCHQRFLNSRMAARFHIFPSNLVKFTQDAIAFR